MEVPTEAGGSWHIALLCMDFPQGLKRPRVSEILLDDNKIFLNFYLLLDASRDTSGRKKGGQKGLSEGQKGLVDASGV